MLEPQTVIRPTADPIKKFVKFTARTMSIEKATCLSDNCRKNGVAVPTAGSPVAPTAIGCDNMLSPSKAYGDDGIVER